MRCIKPKTGLSLEHECFSSQNSISGFESSSIRTKASGQNFVFKTRYFGSKYRWFSDGLGSIINQTLSKLECFPSQDNRPGFGKSSLLRANLRVHNPLFTDLNIRTSHILRCIGPKSSRTYWTQPGAPCTLLYFPLTRRAGPGGQPPRAPRRKGPLISVRQFYIPSNKNCSIIMKKFVAQLV